MTPLRGSLVILLALTGAPSSSAAPPPNAPVAAPVPVASMGSEPIAETPVRVEVGPSVALVYDEKGSVIAVE